MWFSRHGWVVNYPISSSALSHNFTIASKVSVHYSPPEKSSHQTFDRLFPLCFNWMHFQRHFNTLRHEYTGCQQFLQLGQSSVLKWSRICQISQMQKWSPVWFYIFTRSNGLWIVIVRNCGSCFLNNYRILTNYLWLLKLYLINLTNPISKREN